MQFHKITSLAGHVMAVASILLSASAYAQDSAPQASPTTWVNPQGKAVEAEFVRLENDSVVLRLKSSGQEVPVRLSSLSFESHLQALKLADPEAFSKPLIKVPEKTVLETFVPEFTLTGDELLKSPFPSDPTVEQFLDTGIAELKRGNSFVAWHALPPKMQNDVEDLMVKAMSKLGPQPIVQWRNLLKSLNNVVQEKRDFILAYPAVASQPSAVAQLETQWPKLAGLFSQLSDESKWQQESFAKGKILPWLAGLIADIAPYVDAIAKESENAGLPQGNIAYTVLSQSAGMAEVEFNITGLPPQKVRLQKVGSVWLVPSMMNDMRQGVDEATKQLDGDFNVGMISYTMIPITAIAGTLERAETQAEFNKAVDDLLALLGGPGGAGALAGGAGSPGGAAGNPNSPAAPPAVSPTSGGSPKPAGGVSVSGNSSGT